MEAQVDLILQQLPEAVAWPENWSEIGLDYLCRNRTVLVRDSDLPRLREVLDGEPELHDNNVNGVTRYRYVEDAHPELICDRLDRTLGRHVVSPDHVLYLCTHTACP